MPKQKRQSAGRKPTSVRLTPDNGAKLADLIAVSADQSDAINVAISDSWWMRIGMKRQDIKNYVDVLTSCGENDVTAS